MDQAGAIQMCAGSTDLMNHAAIAVLHISVRLVDTTSMQLVLKA